MNQQVLVQAISILELSEQEAEPLYALLDEAKREEILSRKDEKDRLRGLVGYLLASLASKKELPVHFERGTHGKPYLPGGPQFSISHSGPYVVCAISEEEVGVDLQRHTEVDFLPIAERFYQKEEIRLIKESEDPKRAFFDIWAKKESILKCSGVGLSRDFEKIPALQEEVRSGKERYYPTLMPFLDGYSLALCGKKQTLARFSWVGLGTILDLIKK